LVKVNGSFWPIAGNSHTKDLTNLPQVLGFKSLRQFGIELIKVLLEPSGYIDIVNVNQNINIIFYIREKTRVYKTLYKTPYNKFLFN
jgi:hypothetical protein